MDIGQLDNVGISNNSGRISKMNSHVLTHIDASDHKPVISTFDIRGKDTPQEDSIMKPESC